MPSAARKDLIEEAARRVFLQAGYAGARTKQIASEAGVTEALVYKHFSSKSEMFEAAVLDPLESQVTELAKLSERAGTLASHDFITENVQFHRDFFSAISDIAPLLGAALFENSSEMDSADFYQRRLVPLLQRIDQAVQQAFQVFPHSDVSPSLVTSMMIGTYYWIALRGSFEGPQGDPYDIASQVNRIIARGVRR